MCTLYERITTLCKAKGVSGSRMCMELGISKSTLSDMKHGRTKGVSTNTAQKIASYLGVTVGYLLGKEEAPQESRRKGVKIPVLGIVPAGIPIEAIQDIIDYEEITEDMARNGEYIGLKVKGDSMIPKICDGDVVIVRLQPDVESGETAIVMVNGDDATCKKVVKHQGGITLVPNNPAYEPRYFTKEEINSTPVRVIGKVVELRRKF